MSHSKILCVVTLSLCGLGACDKDHDRAMTPASRPAPPPPAQTTPPGTQQPTTQPPQSGAVDKAGSAKAIATALCNRQVSCNNVGPDKQYTTREECIMGVEPDARSELDSGECPSGVQQVKLEECVQEIRDQDCSEATDATAVVGCRTAALCLEQP